GVCAVELDAGRHHAYHARHCRHPVALGHSPRAISVELHSRLRPLARARAPRHDTAPAAPAGDAHSPDARRADATYLPTDRKAFAGVVGGGAGLPWGAGADPAGAALSHGVLPMAV